MKEDYKGYYTVQRKMFRLHVVIFCALIIIYGIIGVRFIFTVPTVLGFFMALGITIIGLISIPVLYQVIGAVKPDDIDDAIINLYGCDDGIAYLRSVVEVGAIMRGYHIKAAKRIRKKIYIAEKAEKKMILEKQKEDALFSRLGFGDKDEENKNETGNH